MSSALFENLSDSELRNHHKLREAIRCRDEKLVQLLVQNGARVNGIHHGESKIFGYLTPLHLAVISRSPTIVKMLLDSGADSNSQILDDETPLTMAAKGHNTAIMDIFLSHNLRHSKNANGLSHLHVACMRNNIVAVKKLILMNQGNTVNDAVSQNSVCWAGYTALHFAVYFECMETIQILLNSGANILAKESKQLTPLHLANLCRNEEIIDLLLSAQRDEFQNPTDSEGLSHFHIACTRDNVSTVEHFLRLNVDIDLEVQSPSWKGWKPIHFAIYYECPNIVKLLLSKGTQLRAICSQKLLSCAFTLKNHIFTELSQVTTMQLDGNSADIRKNLDLLLAILQDKTEEMNKISFGNQAKSSWDSIVANNALWTGCTPLHLSLRYRIMDLAKALLVEGNNVMAQDAKGKTSLHIAFKLYCFFHKIFEPILGNLDNESLNFEVIDDENNFLAKTAQDRFWLKAYKGLRTFKETFHLITEHVQLFHQNLSDDEGLSVFHILCSTNYVELVETFIKNGVDVNAQVKSNSTSWGGYTALHFAVQFRQLKVIDTLLKYNSDISITNALGLNPFDLIIEQLESRVSIAYLKLFFDMTMKILSSNKFEGLNDRGVSLLHGLCVDPSTDLESLEKYLVAHPDELPKALNMPRSAWHKSTPLHLAMKFCSEEHVKLMLHHMEQIHPSKTLRDKLPSTADLQTL